MKKLFSILPILIYVLCLVPVSALAESDKQDIDLAINVSDKVYGEDVKCTVYASVDGEYVLVIDGLPQTTITVRDNLASYNAGKLDAGSYHATVSFSGNDDYNSTSAEDTFTVSQAGTPFEITASTSESVYGETVTITHTLPDDAYGTIKYFLNDGTFLGETNVSESLDLHPLLDAGTYVVIAQYTGDPNHGSATDTALITRRPAKLTITGVTASDKVYDGTNTATIDTSSATMSGLVTPYIFSLITFTGTFEDANVGNGKPVTVTAFLPASERNYVVESINTPTASITQRTLTITANDQEYTYNGQIQGESDTAYEDPAEIAEKITVEGLQGYDAITSIIIDGQGQEVGEYELVPSNATVGEATGNYDIKYVNGKLTISCPHNDIVTDPAVEPTCTEPGKTEGKHCSVCGTVLVAQEEIPALGHTEVVDPAVDPTCTEPGKTEGKHCSVCNVVLVAQEEIPALDHTEVVDPAVDPTCTESGKTEGKHCSVCGTVLVVQETVEALGHDWGEWKITTEPGIGKAGEQQRTCNRCGETETELIAVLIGYTVTEGADDSWTKGSGVSFTITVKRSEDDANCFSHYTETLIDGKVVPVSAKSGSTVITISADTLEKLSTGTHTVTMKFDDGQAETQLTVNAAIQPDIPVTGDNSHIGFWISLMVLSILSLGCLAFFGRKRRVENK